MLTENLDKDAILALDIGTEFVKVLLAKKDKKSANLDIISMSKVRQPASNMHAGAIADIENCVAICEKAVAVAEKKAGLAAEKVVVGIAGELVKGKTSTVHYHRKNGNRAISEQEMSLIIEKVQRKTSEAATKAVALESGNPNIELRLINSAIVSLVIDGYKVSNPIGFKGSDLTIQIYTAFAPLVHVSAIEKVCSELNLDLIAVAVEPFAVCRACLGDDPESDFSAIVIDVGSGTTDIAVVQNGGVEGTKMFNIGGRSFTTSIARSLGIEPELAEKYKLQVESEELGAHNKQRSLAAIRRNLVVWLEGVNIALEDFDQSEVLPGRILLCGGGANLSALQEALAMEDWFGGLAFARRPIVELVDFSILPGFTNSTATELPCDFITALGLLRVGLDTEEGAPAGNSIRDKLARLLQN